MRNKYSIVIPLFILAAVIMTLLLPSGSLFKENYKIGESWDHADVVAPYDIPLLKSAEEYESDIEESESRYIPVYTFNEEVEERMLEELEARLTVLMPYDSQAQKSAIAELINSISDLYKAGIVSEEDERAASLESRNAVVRIIKNGAISNISLRKLYTTDEARKIAANILSVNSTLSDLHIENYISENVLYDELINNREKEAIVSSIPRSKGLLIKGSLIVGRGDIVTKAISQKLTSYESESKLKSENKSSWLMIVGNFIYVTLILSLSFCFIVFFRKEFSTRAGNILFVLFIYLMMVVFSYVVSRFEILNLYIIPFVIVPFYIVTFYDIRMSIFEYITVLMLCAPFSPEPMNFFFINVVSGLSGVFVLQNSYHRRKIFVSVGVIILLYAMSYIAVAFVSSGNIMSIKWEELFWFIPNIVLFLGLYQLIYIFERIFGFVTNITLFELCDTNHPLLKMMAESAPGTFQHSVQVANLAETAAKSIGANPLYARAGALYHDIGKSENPLYFIENSFSTINPHDDIEPLESVTIIKQHVTDGLKLARKYNLPTLIDDFIVSHHAQSLIYFFYHRYKQANLDEVVEEAMFRYDGPLPVSKEVSICMMADSLEAASRSLKSRSSEDISKLVESVVASQISDGNFEKSLLSFGEITTIKEVFKSKLEGIYHTRIAYPQR